MPLSPELARFLHHIHRTDPDAILCDGADALDALTDAELAVICRAEPGPAVCLYNPVKWAPALKYSSELRARISDELDTLELHLPRENEEGWLGPILRNKSCTRKSERCCSSR